MANIDIQMQDHQGNIIHPQTNAKVVEYKGSNVSNVIDSLVDREELFIQDIEPSSDGLWIDTSGIVTSTTEENIIATQIKKYIDEKVVTKVDKVENSNADILAKIGDTTSLETDTKDSLVGAVNEHELQINNNTKQVSNLSNPNLLINGDFQVWQRGTFFTGVDNDIYTADRWRCNNSVSKGVNVSASTPSALNAIWVKECAFALSYYMENKYNMLLKQIYYLKQNEFTISLMMDNELYTYTATFTDVTNYIEFNINTKEFNIRTSDSNNNLMILITGSNTAGAMHTFRYVKLELGTVCTPFISRPYTEELAMCQRYYEKSYLSPVAPASNSGYGRYMISKNPTDNVFYGTIPFKVTKRTTPTITTYKTDGSLLGKSGITATDNIIDINTSADSSLLVFQWVADAEIY